MDASLFDKEVKAKKDLLDAVKAQNIFSFGEIELELNGSRKETSVRSSSIPMLKLKQLNLLLIKDRWYFGGGSSGRAYCLFI